MVHHARFRTGDKPLKELLADPLQRRDTSEQARRILFYEMMAADAFPLMGSMTRWDGIEEYNTRMLCGTPTLNPRLKDIPVRIPQPQPDVPISIYEIQKGLKKRAFDVLKQERNKDVK